MKKRITRTLTMLMAIVMLMGLLTVNAGAISVFDYDYKTDSMDWGSFRPTQDYADYLKTEEQVNQKNALGFVDSATINTKQPSYTPRYLNTLRQYMPHVTDAQRADVTVFDYKSLNHPVYYINGWTNTADASQFASTVNTLVSQRNTLRQDTSLCWADQTAKLKPLGKAANDQWIAYTQAGKTTHYDTASIAKYDSSKMTDEKTAKLRSGAFISFDSYDYCSFRISTASAPREMVR